MRDGWRHNTHCRTPLGWWWWSRDAPPRWGCGYGDIPPADEPAPLHDVVLQVKRLEAQLQKGVAQLEEAEAAATTREQRGRVGVAQLVARLAAQETQLTRLQQAAEQAAAEAAEQVRRA